MLRVLMLTLLIFLPAGIFASELNVFAGYTTYAMDSVNQYLRDAVGPTGTVTKVSDGFLLGGDILFPIPGAPGLSLGPRIEYLSCGQGKASNATATIAEDQYVIPLYFGGRYQLDSKGKFSLDGKAFLGLGIGYATTHVQALSGNTISDVSNSYSGTGLALELGVGGAYNVSSSVDIILDGLYRYADLGAMGSGGYGGGGGSSSSSGGGGGGGYYSQSRTIFKSALSNPSTGNSVTYDYSGIALNLGVRIKFQ